MPGQRFWPFLGASEQAAAILAGLPHGMPWSVGHPGVLASMAAYRHGEPWLDQLLHALTGNITALSTLLARTLPAATFTPPDAGYLVWLDCRDLGWGADPAAVFLRRAKVALGRGSDFGPGGDGFVRLNLACHPRLLEEATHRMARAYAGPDGHGS